jgi:hypothetical protein
MGTFTFANTEVESNIKSEKIENVKTTVNNITTVNEEFASCTDISFNWMDFALDVGYSIETATCLGNVAYALCAGWSTSYDTCF